MSREFNHFKQMGQACRDYGAEIVAETVNAIEADVKAAWSAAYRMPVKTRWSSLGPKKPGTIVAGVIAGSTQKFWVLFVEYGNAFWSGRPAMVPSANRHRGAFLAKAKRLEGALRKVGR